MNYWTWGWSWGPLKSKSFILFQESIFPVNKITQLHSTLPVSIILVASGALIHSYIQTYFTTYYLFCYFTLLLLLAMKIASEFSLLNYYCKEHIINGYFCLPILLFDKFLKEGRSINCMYMGFTLPRAPLRKFLPLSKFYQFTLHTLINSKH